MRIVPIAAAVAALLTATGCSALDMDDEPRVVEPPTTVSAARVERVRADIDALTRSGLTGVIATLTENGQTVTLASGVSDRATGTPIPMSPPQRVRVGSIAKTFVATVILQLVTEQQVRLDEPVDTYLPGLLVGDGVDGRAITVRQLLQHRSGLPEFSDMAEVDEYRAALAGRTFTPAEEVALALRKPAQFAPGTRYKYTNTNYVVAAMLVEKVTGKPYSEELARRITTPLQLPDTYLPPSGELDIRGPHLRGYADIDGVRTDVTRIEPSVPWAAGALISTGADLNHFFAALLAGKVVADPELREMLTGLPQDTDSPLAYGLGIGSTELPCGAQYFGHTGGIYGYYTISGATREGRAVTFAINDSTDTNADIVALLDHALCP
ncbi:serine hydrolase domain-containing protein [Nocardia sp. NPDC050406]|uniref:serine hydrolase domain-containing protein n=1 Tax=Nocardia sp. NPDC050406 TaxID=3364318 RepID=UPI0037BDB803